MSDEATPERTAIEPRHDPRDYAPAARDAGADPRDASARHGQLADPASGTSDDPRVDPTPDLRQTRA